MKERRIKGGWQIAAGASLALLLMALGIYTGGYFALSTKFAISKRGEYFVRQFKYKWQATIYEPAVIIESRLTGEFIAADDGD